MAGPSASKFSARARMALGLGPLVALTLVVFQNCSDISLNWQKTSGASTAEAADGKGPTTSSNQTNDGNGHGYDGKPYILIDLSGTCDSNIRAKIYDQGGVGLLVRDNCVDIVPRILARDSFSIVSTGAQSVLQYLGQIFQPQLDKQTPTPTPSPSTIASRSCINGVSQLMGAQRIASIDLQIYPNGLYANLHLKISNASNPAQDEDLNYGVKVNQTADFYISETATPEHGMISVQLTLPSATLMLDSSRTIGLGNENFIFSSCTTR